MQVTSGSKPANVPSLGGLAAVWTDHRDDNPPLAAPVSWTLVIFLPERMVLPDFHVILV